MIELGYQLAYFINKELQKQNNHYEKKSYDPDYCKFSEEELERIEDLHLDCINDISGLENLKKLKKLTIDNKFLERTNIIYNPEMNYPYNSFKDFSSIEKLENLESLIIMDNMFITSFDLKNLKNLKNLIIFNTPNLEKLKNLDTLKNLKNVVICGTSILNEMDFYKYKTNTKHCKKNFLDINMYPHLKNYNSNDSNVKFAERIGQFDFVLIPKSQVDILYMKSISIIKDLNLLNLSKEKQIKYIYDYVIKNIKFDYDGLQNRYELIKNNPETLISMKNDFGMIHSSYNALIKGKSNCEGYVNLMKFILNILGIKSYDVHCKLHKDKNLYANNHSIIKIEYNNKYRYCDPSLEQTTNEDYFLKSFDEIKKTHSLGLFEELNARENMEVELDGNNNRKHFK